MTHPLLTPRYMVEADYPNSPYEVGQIIDFSEPAEFKSGNVIGTDLPETFYNKYDNIFTPLNWFENRDIKDLPRYLRRKDSVIHVEQYYKNDKGVSVLATHSSARYPIEWYTPATEAEYLEYLKSKEK